MDFIKYPSINKSCARNKPKLTDCQVWNVTEKVHGSNISIYVNLKQPSSPSGIKFAKRTGFIMPEDKQQFPYESWFDNNKENIFQIAENIKTFVNPATITENSYAIIYGEIYGGWYPSCPAEWHGSSSLRNEIELQQSSCPETRIKPIQWDIYYSPTVSIICFDILLVTPINNSNPLIEWLPNSFVRKQPINHVPHMFTGTYDDCVKFANSGAKYVNSYIPQNIHGLCELPEKTNIMEGVVISPESGPHITFKIKNKEFMETVSRSHIPKTIKENKGHPFINYLTSNRWNAVRSKYGVIVENELKAAFIADALEEYFADGNDASSIDINSKYIQNAIETFYESHIACPGL